MIFEDKANIPKGKEATYARIVYAIRPQKLETHRVCLTAGENLISYDGIISTPAVEIATI